MMGQLIELVGADCWTRTCDPVIKNQLDSTRVLAAHEMPKNERVRTLANVVDRRRSTLIFNEYRESLRR